MTSNKTALLESYNNLPDYQKAIVLVLSVEDEPITRTDLINNLSSAGYNKEFGKITTTELLHNLKELLELDLVVGKEKSAIYYSTGFKTSTDVATTSHWTVNKDIVNDILWLTAEQKWGKQFLDKQKASFENTWSYYGSNKEQRHLRIAIVRYNEKDIRGIAVKPWATYNYKHEIFAQMLDNPFRKEWFDKMPAEISQPVLYHILVQKLARLEKIDIEISCFVKYYEQKPSDVYTQFLAEYYFLRGEFAKINDLKISGDKQSLLFVQQGVNFYLKGDYDNAALVFEQAIKLHWKETGARNSFFDTWQGLFHILTLFKQNTPTSNTTAAKHLQKNNNTMHVEYRLLDAVHHARENRMAVAQQLYKNTIETTIHSFWKTWLLGLNAAWFFQNDKKTAGVVANLFDTALQNHYFWAAMELAAIGVKLNHNTALNQRFFDQIHSDLKVSAAVNLFAIETDWERSLRAIENFSSKNEPQKEKGPVETRLAWFINFLHKRITPCEQKVNKSGKWSSGKNIAVKRIKETGIPFATEQDLQVFNTYQPSYHGGWDYSFNRMLPVLVGHPHLFLDDGSGAQVELIKEQLYLVIEEKNKKLEVGFSADFDQQGVVLQKETHTRYKVIEVTEKHVELASAMNGKKMTLPTEAKDRLQKVLGSLTSVVPVQSQIAGDLANIPKVEADKRIYALILPQGDGFKLEFYVKPFTATPPYFKPGIGGANIIADRNNEKIMAVRNIEQEKKLAQQVWTACPSLSSMESYNDLCSLVGPEACLNALIELQAIGENLVVEWPEGERLKLKQVVSLDNLHLRISKQKDWFGVTGQLELNEGIALDIKRLMELMEASPNSKFLQLSEGQFIALTTELRKRLEELNAFSERSKKDVRINPLSALALEDFTENVTNLEIDAAWKKQIKSINEALNRTPKIPSTLQADLREYQEDGFRWLSRLSSWGVGACLADDMGLGKTLQALTLILERAGVGATLVIAPASVCRNWMSEAAKFAPSLNAILFGTGDRKLTIMDAKPFDLIVCSYGLLQSEAELMTSVNWATIILDEAQAIKNTTTKTSKTAMLLQGNFKVVTTGTPIQNHLGELWNLFNFINPGLLGSLQQFNERFAVPIQQHNDKRKREQLRKLIQPFILRRTKSQVLSELPEKTEITLSVEMSDKELAFYEATRQKALKSIEGKDLNFGERQMRILAEITRLRLACCHPDLVMPDSGISSSKLAVFAETVQELIENRHKALVFSQFVLHLDIIRKYLDEQKISYQYLDGSTPLKERERSIKAFQGGEGDLFLISLKAGGVGLNLTAADYVIHLDPWWNPAVEDQASDRAHRIGQQRPVTIYRLVTKNTIEEKIVTLHHDKRDLADSLLEGTDISAKVTGEELLKLIKES